MGHYTNLLAQYDQQFEKVEAMGGGGIPDGTYPGEVLVARIEPSEFDNTQLQLRMEVQTDAGKSVSWLPLTNLRNDKHMSFVKGQLKNIGYEGPLSGLEDWLEGSLIGAIIEIKVETNEYTNKEGQVKHGKNVYYNRVVTPASTPTGGIGSMFGATTTS